MATPTTLSQAPAPDDRPAVRDPVAGSSGSLGQGSPGEDLTLKFDAQELVAALGDVAGGECRVVRLTGNLEEEFGGTEMGGEDVIPIQLRPGSGL